MGRIIGILLALLPWCYASGQGHVRFPVLAGSEGFSFSCRGSEGLTVRLALPWLGVDRAYTPLGPFAELSVDFLLQSYSPGSPQIPYRGFLIEVPTDAQVSVRVTRHRDRLIWLDSLGFSEPIVPAQPSVSKRADPDTIPFLFDAQLYSQDRFLPEHIAAYHEVGTLRAARLGHIVISPIHYNPAQGVIRVIYELEVEVVFETTTMKRGASLERLHSPFFSAIPGVINTLARPKALVTNTPVTYVIVADPMFQQALAPFVDWKRLKGFQVIEAYTNDPQVGNTTGSIRSYLANLFANPPPGYNPPTFGLLVGDVAQIPAFPGNANHVTDLYYFEYTNDRIPEVFYGRFSAQSVGQLIPQIQKTLAYERFLMADGSYLANHVLVAGVDNTFAPVHGNGQVRYAHSLYSNPLNGVTPFTYLFNDAAGSTTGIASGSAQAAGHIRDRIGQGAGWVNYTGHCTPTGWLDPGFLSQHIGSLGYPGRFGVWVSNCCEANRFNMDPSFGEAALRAEGRGAVGHIGASNLSFWNEDYYFAVGLGTPSAHPKYQEHGPGFYDALFRTQPNEAGNPSRWFITQGQMIVAGNLAVQSSNSHRKDYYWEIYHLLGDPSLMPFLRVPSSISYSLTPQAITHHTAQVTITTAPHAQVALTRHGQLLGVGFTDGSGAAQISLTAGHSADSAILVITAQNHIPLIDTLPIHPLDEPLILLQGASPASTPYHGSQIDIGIALQNVAPSPHSASQVEATLTTSSPHVTIGNGQASAPLIGYGQTVHLPNAFRITLSPSVPDQSAIPFTVHITAQAGAETLQWSRHFSIIAHAPLLSIGSHSLEHFDGPPTQSLDPGDSAIIRVPIINLGHAPAQDVEVHLQALSPDWLTLTGNPMVSVGLLLPGNTIAAGFAVRANANAPIGSMAGIQVVASCVGYTTQRALSVPIGYIPSVRMGDVHQVTQCMGRFVDSGGEAGDYTGGESHTITFHPPQPGSSVLVRFDGFALEQGFDFLYAHDGPDTHAPQFAGSPFTGEGIPGPLMATNPQGAITFAFRSDATTSLAGWDARLECVDMGVPPPCAQLLTPVSQAEVTNTPATLRWEFTPGALRYYLYVGPDELPALPTDTLAALWYDLNVASHSRYVWRVVPANQAGRASGCASQTFTTSGVSIHMRNGTLTTCGANFFDSGGAAASYSNSEELVLTVRPAQPFSRMRVNFTGLSLEQGFDSLSIHDGPNVHSPRLAGLSGITLPPPIEASNSEGALTFRFLSDGSLTRSGWQAHLMCVRLTVPISIRVVDPQGAPIEGARVAIGTELAQTNSLGMALLHAPAMESHPMAVTMPGFTPHSGTLPVGLNPMEQEITLWVVPSLANLGLLPSEGPRVYPNPFSSAFRITSPFPIASIRLLCMLGNPIIHELGHGALSLAIARPDLPAGPYALHIAGSRGERAVVLVVKQ